MANATDIVTCARRIKVLHPGIGDAMTCLLATTLIERNLVFRLDEAEQPGWAETEKPEHRLCVLVRDLIRPKGEWTAAYAELRPDDTIGHLNA